MRPFREYRRGALIPLAVIVLAAYYLLVSLPLAHRAEAIEERLKFHWGQLAAALDQKTNEVAIDFQRITNQLEQTRLALAQLRQARAEAEAQFKLSPALRAKMKPPFQVVEFENDRGQKMDQLSSLAKQCQVALDPAVLAGFPEYTTNVVQAALLWPALSMVDGLLVTAVHCKVAALCALESPLVPANPSAPEVPARVAQIPLQLEVVGPAANVLLLIQTLPLRAEQLRAAGFTNAPPGKLPLLLDRLIIKKQSPDKPDEVRAALRVVGFVFPE
jgi:hypothetical protein